ncbi:MAG: histidinol dehydrogenase [Rhodospirillaceae bacterium]|nr:histidinol dehydrogenase [Rhodospirillaceae bacterium]|tara:strand:+ start:112 stop:1413 length:1302 start_codon:yes stop_codon:yes gene_type:complete
MPTYLNTKKSDFKLSFTNSLNRVRDGSPNVSKIVSQIIADVKADGDAALIKYTSKFDLLDLCQKDFFFSKDDLSEALNLCDQSLLEAIETAAHRIRNYHEKQMPENSTGIMQGGVRLDYRWTAVNAAGLYVPGGTAPLFSSVLMNAIPAQVAGVNRLIVALPTPSGNISPAMLAACKIIGVTEVCRLGGAQAIAALAFGTDTVQPVDVIVGPGNSYVAEAKRQVFGVVGIDMVAGPSEITIVADKHSKPDWIAADLLAQSEHDESSQSILITDDAELANLTVAAVEKQLAHLSRGEIARKSWNENGLVILVESMLEVPPLVDAIAPEHLELALENPEPLLNNIRNAGAIFIGYYTPEAIGDYVAGPSHVLPTSGTARFSSGLSVMNFLKRTSLIECTENGLAGLGKYAIRMAREEGLTGHAKSVSIRLDEGHK